MSKVMASGELSAKTQVVGDVNEETANKFLLAVDAAYKYKGNIDALTRVLDGANEISNNLHDKSSILNRMEDLFSYKYWGSSPTISGGGRWAN